ADTPSERRARGSSVATENVATISRLRGLVEVSRLIRAEEDLPALLAAIGRTIADCLGFGTVAINLYRPAYDDVVVTSVHGSDAARQALLGDARELSAWAPFLDGRDRKSTRLNSSH